MGKKQKRTKEAQDQVKKKEKANIFMMGVPEGEKRIRQKQNLKMIKNSVKQMKSINQLIK